jgi:hypothetical protein
VYHFSELIVMYFLCCVTWAVFAWMPMLPFQSSCSITDDNHVPRDKPNGEAEQLRDMQIEATVQHPVLSYAQA